MKNKSKRETYFEKVNEYKARFEKMSSDELKRRLNRGALIKEAAIAIRQILEERNEI